MSIYCPFAEALGIETSKSILDIPEPEWSSEEAKKAASEMSKRIQTKRLKDKTHHFLDKSFQSKNGKKGYIKSIETGNHHSLQNSFRLIASKRIENGTHNFLDSEAQRRNVMKGIDNGTHSSCKEHVCPHCGKIGRGGGMKKWHFDNCKQKSD